MQSLLKVILPLTTMLACAVCKLPCQTEMKRRDTPQVATTIGPVGELRSVTSSGTGRSAPTKPDLCCGPKPFNTGIRACCMGRLVLKSRTRCCLSGNPVPRGVDCACDPHSGWIQNQSTQLRALDIRYRSLAEVMEDAKSQMKTYIDEKELLVQELDTLQTGLWRAFLKQIGIGRSQDPEEVQYIYDLVTFLHSNEGESEEENHFEERELGHSLNDAEPDQKIELRKVLRKLLSRNKGIMQRMISAGSRSLGVDNDVIQYTTEGQGEGEEIPSLRTYRKALLPVAKEELEENLESSNEEEVERIILERNRILKQITNENELIFASLDRLKILEKVIENFLIDLRLISSLRELLDDFLRQVMEKEDEAREIAELERETEDFEEERLESSDSPDGKSGCDVTRWTSYISNFTDRVDAATADFQDILDPESELMLPNERANDPVSQQRSLLSNFLQKRTYDLTLLRFTRLKESLFSSVPNLVW